MGVDTWTWMGQIENPTRLLCLLNGTVKDSTQ